MDTLKAAVVSKIIADLIGAISEETALYWAHPDGVSDDAADEATSRVNRLEERLVAVPPKVAALEPDYTLALALVHKRWLVCEGSYASPHDQTDCRLVDALLAGTRFDDVPLLWHVAGVMQKERPSDAVLHASWTDEAEKVAA